MQWFKTWLAVALAILTLEWNILAFAFFRIDRHGLSVKPITTTPSDSEKLTIIVSGLMSRTPAAFKFLLDSGLLEGKVYYMDYRNRGLDPTRAAGDILHQIRTTPHSGGVTLISASMGYRVANRVAKWYPGIRQIAICPCLGAESLNPKSRKILHRFVPVGKKITGILNFISFLPLVPVAHGYFYSLALLMDQYELVSGETQVTFRPGDLVILADAEDILNPAVLEDKLSTAPVTRRRVAGTHCDFKHHGEEYLAAIKDYL